MIHIIILIMFLKTKWILFSFIDFIQKSVHWMHLWSQVFIIKSRLGSKYVIISDTSYPVLCQILQVWGTILHKTALTSDTGYRYWSLQGILTSDGLAKIQDSHYSLKFDNSLERLKEMNKALY